MTSLISVSAALVALIFAGSAAAEAHERASKSKTARQIAASPGLTMQAALDRAGFSPGEIDGRPGAVTKRALAAFQKEHRLTPTGDMDGKSWAALGVEPGKPEKTITQYSIAAEDVEGPFTSEIPEDLEAKAELPALGYTGVVARAQDRRHVGQGRRRECGHRVRGVHRRGRHPRRPLLLPRGMRRTGRG